MTDPLYPDWHGNLDKTAIMERYTLALSRKDARIRELEAQMELKDEALVAARRWFRGPHTKTVDQVVAVIENALWPAADAKPGGA